jgi:molybdenum cofactor cytidylyltransferase
MITAIVLAAGMSSRLGRPKQLLDLGGKPLLQHALDTAEGAPVEEVIVVLGHRSEAIAAALRLGDRTRVAVNPNYGAGQSSSLHTGLRGADPRSNAAVVLLGDQPLVRVDAVAAVVAAYRSGAGPVVQAGYGGRPGHPTLLDRSLWPELETTSGDEGARRVLERRPERRVVVEVGGTPPEDIDTEEDYAGVRSLFDAQ